MLPNISRSKGNQAMKFGQFIECNMRNLFLEKSYTKCGGETIPRTFSEKSKLSIPFDQQFEVFYSLFLRKCQVESYRNILKLSKRPLAFTAYEAFLKHEESLKLFFLPQFLHDIFFSCITDHILLFGFLYFVRFWAVCVLQLFVNHVLTS